VEVSRPETVGEFGEGQCAEILESVSNRQWVFPIVSVIFIPVKENFNEFSSLLKNSKLLCDTRMYRRFSRH
jgi:hypothetical protein